MTDVETPPQPESSLGGPSWQQRITGVGTSLARSLLIPTLAVLTALIIGGIIIAFSDPENLQLLFTDTPQALGEMVSEVWASYRALFRGSLGSINSISETLFAATPLLLAGLGVALGFQAGLFNIGAQGQMLIGALVATYVGLYVTAPGFIHIPLTLLAGVLGGVIWAGIPGVLKARTGAHEVITTIMFNFIALYFIQWILTTPGIQDPGRENPVSAALAETARLPRIFGSQYRVTLGFLIALGAVGFVHWLLFHSTTGFEFRAVGKNPKAARYAGINTALIVTLAMAIAGALAGLAGANQVMGLDPYKASPALAGTVGFDAITVALLGRSHPIGVLWSALLFGALSAGGRTMQGAAQVPIDLVVVLQALIVIFVAAPGLIRSIYRLKVEDEAVTNVTTGWGS
ncbi:MAG TPA: ABC transporter permease [Acidimicrobiia bacterium]|jgi:simple sugar transport system permease protein|nr:ABC transporter permease [Acidimicrobiia bacterium]